MSCITSLPSGYSSSANLKNAWEMWWSELWEMDIQGDCGENCPFTSRYFHAITGRPFFEAQADRYDKKVFDLFLAIEDEDFDLLLRRADKFEECNTQNRALIFYAAKILAEELELRDMAKYLDKKLSFQAPACRLIDKSLEDSKELEIVSVKQEEKKEISDGESKSFLKFSTIAKVALVGALILGAGIGAYYLYQWYNPAIPDLNQAPYDLGKDTAGIPLPSCDHPEFWPAHEAVIKEGAMSCSVGRDLSSSANAAGAEFGLKNWDLKIISREKCETGAMADLNENRVYIACDNQDPVKSALFELGNLKRNREFREVHQRIVDGLVKNRDQFAYEYEEVEFGTLQEHSLNIDRCIKEKGWSKKSALNFSLPWREWWNWISTTRHAEIYRENFDERTVIGN